MDAITGFSYFPLQIMIYVSFVLGVLAVLGIPIIAILRVVVGDQFLWRSGDNDCVALTAQFVSVVFPVCDGAIRRPNI